MSKTIEVTRGSLADLLIAEQSWFDRARKAEAEVARLRDELQGVTQSRNTLRGQLETLKRDRDRDVEELREALTQAVTARNQRERAAARKRANEALVLTVTCPF